MLASLAALLAPTLGSCGQMDFNLLPIFLDDVAKSRHDIVKGLCIRLLVIDIGEGLVPGVDVNVVRGIADGADERHAHVDVTSVTHGEFLKPAPS